MGFEAWPERQLSRVPIGDVADAVFKTGRNQLENDLAVHLEHQGAARLLEDVSVVPPALAKEGAIRAPST
jgi:hypothetical protein